MDHSNSLILIDIDHFKDINDTYGHSAGDAVLKQFAQILKKRLRESDLISRWGGEEFLILAPFTDITNASQLAETLRKSVEEAVFTYEKQTIDIKITAGVTELISSKPIVESLKRVDKLLYQGKTDGRNRVVTRAA
jgi:diguanylate cyclase (GGDEF)-like protein